MFRGSVSVSYSNFPSLAYLEIRGRRDAADFLSLVSIEKGISGVEKDLGVCQPVVLDLAKMRK